MTVGTYITKIADAFLMIALPILVVIGLIVGILICAILVTWGYLMLREERTAWGAIFIMVGLFLGIVMASLVIGFASLLFA